MAKQVIGIGNAANDGRRTGLGTHGLADAVARMNMAYDSEEAIELIGQIYKQIRNVAYATSVELSKERASLSSSKHKKI